MNGIRTFRCEINLTQKCQISCPNCNRGLGDIAKSHWHENPDDVTVAQIEEVIQLLRDNRHKLHCSRAKVLGGEPGQNTKFPEIFWLLAKAAAEGLFDVIKISTNCVDQIPEWARGISKVVWMKSPPSRKKHTPITWSPVDLGIKTQGPCDMPRRCGASLSKDGWLPCSAAIFIVKVFNLSHLYRSELPSEGWGFDELCKHCIHAMPRSWVEEYFRTHKGLEKVEPTETWRKALAEFEERAGVKEKRFSLPMVTA